MARVAAAGYQEFDELIRDGCFYVDKTGFIKEWWENKDRVTLITRPRRFGKTLTMSMVEQFFSVNYKGSRLFQGLDIWKEERYRNLQGTYPVIFLSFADVKENNFENAKRRICRRLADLYSDYSFLLDNEKLNIADKIYFENVVRGCDSFDAADALYYLSKILEKCYGNKAVILLDEYDTPMQEAYVNGYWEKLSVFMRSFFNASFKTNRSLERALLTGITRIGRESMFSGLNNLEVVTTTSKKYETAFGFTEEEVFQALEEYGLSDKEQEIKEWYDGFHFGNQLHMYNPWSIINFLNKREFETYWVNTSSNALVSSLIQKSNKEIKISLEELMKGGKLCAEIDEEIAFGQLNEDEEAVWSLLLAGGYLKVEKIQLNDKRKEYILSITNYEVHQMFKKMVRGWFAKEKKNYNRFINALLADDIEKMNICMNEITMASFSYFDTGKRQSENFYHAFVLGLAADLGDEYEITSNMESGLGRYDIMLIPKNSTDNGMIMEFKVYDPRKENSLNDTVVRALAQIEDKKYDTVLLGRGILSGRIKKYGFAFKGKEVLIGR